MKRNKGKTSLSQRNEKNKRIEEMQRSKTLEIRNCGES
jgi:hypothetical protein